jgi:hypothetical protein
MIDGLMRELTMRACIAWVFIGSHQRDLMADRLPNKIADGGPVCSLDDLATSPRLE